MKNILAAALLATVSLLLCTPRCLAQMRNGLPPTQMDSFVRQAAGNAENIYGDEGHEGPPPFDYFEYQNRINSGIYDIRDRGLTTGHGSYMPSAWGRDEFLGAEWSQSGANGGNANLGGSGTTEDQNGNPQNGRATPATLPYQINANWNVVRDANGNVLGYMAPGETYQQFLSGQSGHLLPGFQDETGTLLAQVQQYGRGSFSVAPVSSQAVAANHAAIQAARIKAQQEAQAAAAEAQAIQQSNAQGPQAGAPTDPSMAPPSSSDAQPPTDSSSSDSGGDGS